MKRVFFGILLMGTSVSFGFMLGMLYSFVGVLASV